MLHSFIRKNTYKDSIDLMLLSVALSDVKNVNKATVMMGTAANLEIMKKSGFDAEGIDDAKPNDLVAVVDTDDLSAVEQVKEEIERSLKGETRSDNSGLTTVKTWDEARRHGDKYNICLISVPGEYAADEARMALNQGKHVFMFSDNVTLKDELELKRMAHEKGLIMMGPDCGTAIIQNVPFGFANDVRSGEIGIVGASGTGIQEVAVQIDHMGGGISNAIGTGGRDLNREIGAITMLDGIDVLAADPMTKVLVIISKPPAEEVCDYVLRKLLGMSKPAVVLFLGDDKVRVDYKNLHFVSTTIEAAQVAMRLCGEQTINMCEMETAVSTLDNARLLGLFAGGTLACEAAIMTARALGVEFPMHGDNGIMLDVPEACIIDLGDDFYTRGKPHPMIDGECRNRYLREISVFERPTVLLFDVELGSGSGENPSQGLADTIRQVIQQNAEAGVPVHAVVNLMATDGDYQNRAVQKALLEAAGARVFSGNVPAVRYALALCGHISTEAAREDAARTYGEAEPVYAPSEALRQLFTNKPSILNIGIKSFTDALTNAGAEVIHFSWKPACGGDKLLRRAVDFLDNYVFQDGPYRTIDEANRAVVDRIQQGQPYLLDVVPAYTVCPVLEGKVLLHAGPPMKYFDMTSPMQGSCIGAVLFEEWAKTEEEARRMLESGEIKFMPCHHVDFVGPMGGITSGHMPVLKVFNRVGGNYAYCTMNEGIGAVLRFGAYSAEVIERLRFMRDTLGPVLSMALKCIPDGLALNTLVSKAIAMGDEFHQRNIAASMAFLKEVAPLISALDIAPEKKTATIRFLAVTDQFFLNVMMAMAKSVMDYAATVTDGTIVTVMTRNGVDFGVRISGMEKQWFTGPVNTPVGLYFSGYSKEDGNPDMGDSAITETFGVGGMAMIAAPAVTRFVGTGGFYDAQEISNSMSEIVIDHNNMFQIPNWDFKGICNGIDARKVVVTGITPVINTGIAHREAGRGQIGAGTVHPPMECFSKALLAYARKLGFEG